MTGDPGAVYGDVGFTLTLVRRQLAALFDLDEARDAGPLAAAVEEAAGRALACYAHLGNKYYSGADGARLYPFHGGKYCIFLYFLSRALHALGPEQRSLADRVYCLNRTLHGVDFYYEVELPDVFMVDHPLGSVLGRAAYSDFLSVAQNCTVGNNNGVYPRLGRDVSLMAGAGVLGDCTVGDHVVVAADAFVIDTDIPPFSVVFGASPRLTVQTRPAEFFRERFARRFRTSDAHGIEW